MSEETGLAKRGQTAPADRAQRLVERTFDVTVDLQKEQIIDKLKEHPQVEWHDSRPNPFFAKLPFQGWTEGNTVFLRRLEQTDSLVSPTLELEFETRDLNTHVRGRFVPNDNLTKGLPKSRFVRWALLGLGASFFAADLVLLGGAFSLQMALVAVPAAAFAAVARTRERNALSSHGPALLGVVGSVLLPHEVGGERSPFRALPPGSSR